ncbi:hypothetical protein R3P38DRAFT_3377666 [Favolaschia claudopus]|uniref:Uncharacterized protein n=1 Tax=Favolaschia claudopus TaxID=2862362 RepID=A0AAV9ZAQ6_9AGAR
MSPPLIALRGLRRHLAPVLLFHRLLSHQGIYYKFVRCHDAAQIHVPQIVGGGFTSGEARRKIVEEMRRNIADGESSPMRAVPGDGTTEVGTGGGVGEGGDASRPAALRKIQGRSTGKAGKRVMASSIPLAWRPTPPTPLGGVVVLSPTGITLAAGFNVDSKYDVSRDTLDDRSSTARFCWCDVARRGGWGAVNPPGVREDGKGEVNVKCCGIFGRCFLLVNGLRAKKDDRRGWYTCGGTRMRRGETGVDGGHAGKVDGLSAGGGSGEILSPLPHISHPPPCSSPRLSTITTTSTARAASMRRLPPLTPYTNSALRQLAFCGSSEHAMPLIPPPVLRLVDGLVLTARFAGGAKYDPVGVGLTARRKESGEGRGVEWRWGEGEGEGRRRWWRRGWEREHLGMAWVNDRDARSSEGRVGKIGLLLVRATADRRQPPTRKVEAQRGDKYLVFYSALVI